MEEVLIVGQGLAGTWLSWWLHQAGVSFHVIDKPDRDGASMRAAGLINPVTGRRMVTTWMIDELMPFAFHSYGEMGNFLDEYFYSGNIVDRFLSQCTNAAGISKNAWKRTVPIFFRVKTVKNIQHGFDMILVGEPSGHAHL